MWVSFSVQVNAIEQALYRQLPSSLLLNKSKKKAVLKFKLLSKFIFATDSCIEKSRSKKQIYTFSHHYDFQQFLHGVKFANFTYFYIFLHKENMNFTDCHFHI